LRYLNFQSRPWVFQTSYFMATQSYYQEICGVDAEVY